MGGGVSCSCLQNYLNESKNETVIVINKNIIPNKEVHEEENFDKDRESEIQLKIESPKKV